MIEIDDQAYKFFVEEATELLQTLEQGLIHISQEHEIQKLHQLMRAAHSIKGGAACIGLMGIQTIAHDLENSIRALYQENTVFDLELENLLLQAFDCLRSPTVKQIETGNYDQENSIIKAKQVFEQIEKKLGHSLEEAAEFPEVSMEEGDMTKFLFTEEIPSGLHRWENLLAGKNSTDSGLSIQDELKRQAEVFATLGTMLNLPGFTSIAETTIKALEVNPKYIKKIGTLALADFWAGQKAVLAGDRTQGGNLNATLVKLTKPLKSSEEETTAKRKQVNQPTQAVKAVVSQKSEVTVESEVAVETENVKTSNSATASVNISQKQVSAPGVTNQKEQIQQKQITSTSSSSLGIRIDIKRLEMLNNLLGELATQDNSFILQNQLSQAAIGTLEKGWQKCYQLMMKLQDMKTFSEQLNKSPNSQNNQLAYLVNILPNLLEEIAQVGEAVNDIKLLHQQSQQVVKKRQQTLQQIQNNLTKTRMLPVESLLNRFPRMIRDLSVQKQKQVKLELVGMNTLIDKVVLEKLYDPMVHIVRNAFDHGIEPPEIRQSNGKSKEGKITIKSYYQGNYTYIEIRDDGRGIDVNKIRNLAIQKKIFSVTEAAKLSTKQLYKLLFYPDFSTTKKVSDLSGRGMGLESVYSQIESLKGNITIQSQLGQGTKFILRLPWTLTITKLLVFRMEGNFFAIPLDILAAIIYVDPSEIKVERREKVYYWKGKKVSIAPSILLDYNYPIVSGSIQQESVEFSWKNSYTKNSQGKVMLLLISEDSDTIAIKIEQILMEQNLTIKPFSKILKAPSYLYGCTILGDGSLVPVIDGIQLLEKILHTEQLDAKNLLKNTSKFKQSILSKLPTILVIDDSLTTRQAISSTLQKAGYDIVQAKDGWQGLVKLQQNTQIQAVICDVEMPQMNGFEFLSRCRKQYPIAQMPVLMLTSRSSQPYRTLAKQLGANDYLSKPYLDQELINRLQSCLQV
ncbi:MAG: hybrid sensor histidine kinase/response regulator [Okeania sp. SIO2G4]|uniref:hybrid sensor histidine kinase/response regulator n=1 Tax=unclassified Okeania TaxID=2634635 RepID=UPI0013BB031A|nr:MULTISPECIES: hybrid sensor histidine kinase/response regulator [unclassified Okeania]NEP70562.1 hybrid sensor histidine kinase/response regulator [Okeania sp. SIO2G5]NEP93247.1 hybrid sensor histidine kinase/response regulator [Okeania sp. SIO2F5]NEQ89269.1 hybrid sensor histidine kinase/response regulator [Okeania sp. SIO2G4]